MRTHWLWWAVPFVVAAAIGSGGADRFHEPEDRESLLADAADVVPVPAATAGVDLSYRSRFRFSRSGAGFYNRLEGELSRGLRLLMLTEKDPGEARLVDFSALNLMWTRPRLDLVVGDLRPGFAQGLVYARSTRGGRSLSLRSDSERTGFRSTAENASLRGLAARRHGGRAEITVLAGRLAWDGRLEEEDVISLPTSGMHISATEEKGRKIVKAWTAGFRARARTATTRFARFSGGVTLNSTWFERRIDLRRQARTPWAYHGRRQWVGSVDLRATGSRTDGAVEVGREAGGHRGGLATMRLRLVRSSLKIQVRHYDAGFHSFFGAAASATRMQNERGYAMSWSGRWRRLAWEVSADHYAHLQPAQSRPVPAATDIWRCSISRRVAGEDWQLLLQQRRGSVWQSGRERPELSRRLRISHGRGSREAGHMTLRLEGHRAGRGGRRETGALVSAIWRHTSGSIRHAAHLTRFATPSALTRIYEYEQELPGAVSIRSLSGNGWRLYLLTGVAWRGFRTAVRHRIEVAADRRNFKQEIGLQIDWGS